MSTGLEDPGDQHPTHTSSSEDEDQVDWDVLQTPFKTMNVDISSDHNVDLTGWDALDVRTKGDDWGGSPRPGQTTTQCRTNARGNSNGFQSSVDGSHPQRTENHLERQPTLPLALIYWGKKPADNTCSEVKIALIIIDKEIM